MQVHGSVTCVYVIWQLLPGTVVKQLQVKKGQDDYE